jgi:phosphatidylglycerophosphate synthase
METKQFVKAKDAWITVLFFDIFAVPIARFTSRHVRSISPDHFTFGSLYSFVLAVIVLYFDYPILAFILMLLSTTLDCVDGKLARLNQTQTVYGKYMDALSDFLAHSFGFLAISVWFYTKSDYVSAVIVFVWSTYFGYMHISSALPVRCKKNRDIQPPISRWDKWCGRNRLINRPVSVVEIAFFVIPFSIVILDYAPYFMIFFTFVFFINRIFIKES